MQSTMVVKNCIKNGVKCLKMASFSPARRIYVRCEKNNLKGGVGVVGNVQADRTHLHLCFSHTNEI